MCKEHRNGYLRALFALGFSLFGTTTAICGSDCSFSKEFSVNQPQPLSGFLQDPVGAVLPGLQIELLQGKTVVKRLRTTNQGEYNFGEILPGKYKIHIQYGDNVFCAPKVKCGKEGCKLEPRLKLRSKGTIVVEEKDVYMKEKSKEPAVSNK